MWFLIAGVVIIVSILGLFWAKDRFESYTLQKFAHHEMTMRLAVVGVGFIVAGILFSGGEIIEMMGFEWRTTDPDHFKLRNPPDEAG